MTTANQSAAERNITLVSVANIQPSNYNPRKRFDETGLDELAESIKQQGVLQPITVRPNCRHRPLRDCLWRTQIPCFRYCWFGRSSGYHIRTLRTKKAQEMAVTENLQRKTLLLRKKPMLISNSLIVGGIR